jgi:hypothetical protein
MIKETVSVAQVLGGLPVTGIHISTDLEAFTTDLTSLLNRPAQ